MMFIVKKHFALSRGKYGHKDYNKGKIYAHEALKGVEGTGLGDTAEEVRHFLIINGYINLLDSLDLHDVLKALLFRK